MEDKFDELQNSWNQAKKEHSGNKDSSHFLKTAKTNHAKSVRAHLGNILVLVLVVVGLTAFFWYLAPLQDTLSHIGIALMIGGLIVRIIIEWISRLKANTIDYSQSSQDSAHLAKSFYQYRKRIHGPVTITIIALYTIGFYLLTPEFSNYFSPVWMWIIDLSYLVIAIVLFLLIRKGVVREMSDLREIEMLENSLNE